MEWELVFDDVTSISEISSDSFTGEISPSYNKIKVK